MLEFRYVVYGVVDTKRGNEIHSAIGVYDSADDADREAKEKLIIWKRTYIVEECTHIRNKG